MRGSGRRVRLRVVPRPSGRPVSVPRASRRTVSGAGRRVTVTASGRPGERAPRLRCPGMRRLYRAAMEDTQMPEPLRQAVHPLVSEVVMNSSSKSSERSSGPRSLRVTVPGASRSTAVDEWKILNQPAR